MGQRESLRGLQDSKENVCAHTSLSENAQESLWREIRMLRNRDVAAAFAQTDVRTNLTGRFKNQAAERLDSLSAADVAGQFHVSINTGSDTKCRRMRRGTSPASKWQRTAS